jgi:hypothetical protein
MAISVRPTASPEPLMVWHNTVLFFSFLPAPPRGVGRKRRASRRACRRKGADRSRDHVRRRQEEGYYVGWAE